MSGQHPEPEAGGLAALYVAGALTPDERAALEARLATGDEELRAALSAWNDVIVALGSAGAEIEPRPEIREILLARIRAAGSQGPPGQPEDASAGSPGPRGRSEGSTTPDVSSASTEARRERRTRRRPPGPIDLEHPPATVEETGLLVVERAGDGEWKEMGQGASARTLFFDARARRVTMLVRLAAGASYPGHFHAGVEECLVLEGDLRVGDDVLRARDYQRAPAGSWHGVQSSHEGCLCLIFVSLGTPRP